MEFLKGIFSTYTASFNFYKIMIYIFILLILIGSYLHLYSSNKSKAEQIKKQEKSIILLEQNLSNKEKEFKETITGLTSYYEAELIQARNNQKIIYQYKIIEKENAIELTKKVEKTNNLKDFFEVLKGDTENENK